MILFFIFNFFTKPLFFRYQATCHKVANSNMSCLGVHTGFFRLLMKGIFDHMYCDLLAKS